MRSIAVLLFVCLASCSSDPEPSAGGAAGGGGQGLLYYGISVGADIHRLNLATGEDVKLGDGDAPFKTNDGKLVFITPLELAESDESLAMHRIIVKSDLGTEKSNNGFLGPQVSPDGTRIVYVTLDGNLYIANRADGKILTRLEVTGSTEAWERPTWTPDGRVVAAGGFANPGLYISDANVTKMTRFDPMLARPRDPAVSPDGSKVAFVLNGRLHVMNIDGTGMKRIDPTDDDDTQPSWSPDGKKLVYRVSGRLKFLPADGGQPVDLFDMHPALKDKFLVMSGSHPVQWK